MSLLTPETELCDSDLTDREEPRDPKVSLAFPRVRKSPLPDVDFEESFDVSAEACVSSFFFTIEAQVPEEDMIADS